MPALTSFVDHVVSEVRAAIDRIEDETRSDVYALSFFVYDVDDDPRLPTLTVGYNTETYCAKQAGAASSPAEARWNYAFWPQNCLIRVCDPGSPAAALWETVEKEQELYYTDEDEEEDFDSCEHMGLDITELFVETAVKIARQLHRQQTTEQVFGRVVPILIHELEYYPQIADQTEEANPAGIVDDFVDWVYST